MFDTERDIVSKSGKSNDTTILLDEYNDVVENLKRDLQLCKVEQSNIRSELQNLQSENQNPNEIREYIDRIHLEECGNQDFHKKQLLNLQERIEHLQTEKDSVLQLWQLSLNTIDSLEEEMKVYRVDGKSVKHYQEQLHAVKESYTEAIKILEGKLLQVKENFLKQETLCQVNKEKIYNLTKEKDDIAYKYSNLQREFEEKDRNNQLTIEVLKKELSLARAETNKVTQVKLELDKKLSDVKRFAENVVEKDKETKAKMAEAIELIETAVREKELVLHRESLLLEEKTRLELRLATISNEYEKKMQEINTKTKDELENNTKKYLSEIRELNSELREKTVLFDRAQIELKYTGDELEKTRTNLNAKIVEYEQKVKHLEIQLQVYNETRVESKHDNEIQQLMQKLSALEGKLSNSNDNLLKLERHTINTQNRANDDWKCKEMTKEYANLETQLAKTLGDKEDLLLQLKSLKNDFDCEIQKRNKERQSLENKIRKLEVNLQKSSCGTENCGYNVKDKRTLDIMVDNKCHCCQSVLSDHMTKLQDKFDKKIKELNYHVQVHQKLSKRWRDEAKTLTARFQGKTKDFRFKIKALQKENGELNKELLNCKHQLTQYTIQDIQKCKESNDIR